MGADRGLAASAPEVRRSLAPPATSAKVARLEQAIGASLPEDLAESLSIHDGQRRPSFRLPPLFNGEFLLPASDIAKLSRMMTRMQRDGFFETDASSARMTRRREPIKSDLWWRSGWLPFTDENGNYFVCDLDPATGGRRGQVFYFSAYGHSPRRVIAKSFGEWLDLLASDLANGRFKLAEEGIWLPARSKLTT